MWRWLKNLFFKRAFDEFEEPMISTIVYMDISGEVEYEVMMVCSCQDPVDIVKMDDEFDPPLPHFICRHCDRICTQKNCQSCQIYSEMTNARDVASE
jgi:hypothetical protein